MLVARSRPGGFGGGMLTRDAPWAWFVGLLVGVGACGSESTTAGAFSFTPDPVIWTSAPAIQAMAEALTEGLHLPFELRCLVPEGEDPEHWIPDRELGVQMVRGQGILLHGAGLEPWIGVLAVPASRTVSCGDVLRGQLLRREGQTHTHGGSEHTHGGVDPWVIQDPELVCRLASAVVDALTPHLDAALAETLRARLKPYQDRVHAAGAALAAWVAARPGPLYGESERMAYLERFLDLELQPPPPSGSAHGGTRMAELGGTGGGEADLVVDPWRGAAAPESWWRCRKP